MFVAEGPDSGFSSIPQSIYWAIVTITTVGYGDLTPVTVAGKFVASIIMLLGYSIIAVPTGIVTAELSRSYKEQQKKKTEAYCHHCGIEIFDKNANFCRNCGTPLKKK
jgi:voltage-gated potassium channel